MSDFSVLILPKINKLEKIGCIAPHYLNGHIAYHQKQCSSALQTKESSWLWNFLAPKVLLFSRQDKEPENS